MGIISRFTKFDKCVYWAPGNGGKQDRYGKYVYDVAPVEIDCRWSEKIEQIVLPGGENYSSTITVYVDLDLVLGGILWHGLLVSVPDTPPSATIIRAKGSENNLKNSETLRWVYL
jgi:hypothetical protein